MKSSNRRFIEFANGRNGSEIVVVFWSWKGKCLLQLQNSLDVGFCNVVEIENLTREIVKFLKFKKLANKNCNNNIPLHRY